MNGCYLLPKLLRCAAVCLFGVGILSVYPIIASDNANSSIESIAKWGFDLAEDVNYDGWPDAWRRQRDREHPDYIKMKLVPVQEELDAQARGADSEWIRWFRTWEMLRGVPPSSEPPMFWSKFIDRYLRVEMNGGAARLEGPRFPVSSDFSYYLTARQMTNDLKRNQAWCELVFYDSQDRVVATFKSPKSLGTTDWHDVKIGPCATPEGSVWMAVRLCVEPEGRADIRGAAGFDRLELRRFPQLLIDTDNPTGLYTQQAQPKIICRLSGLSQSGATVELALTDVHGKQLEREEVTVELGAAAIDGFYSGHANWEPHLPGPGWYLVTAKLAGAHTVSMEGRRSMAVVSELPLLGSTPFGISLSDGITSVPIQRWPSWLEELRAGWVKLNAWLAPNDRESSDQMAWLTERLSDRGIRTVGVLDQPPPVLRSQFPGSGPLPAATLFRDISTWQPLLEPQMSRLSLRVTWWQIGNDRDLSFADIAQPQDLLDQIRLGLQGFGQPVSVVVSWPFLDPPPTLKQNSGWNAVCLSEPNPLTADEITDYVNARRELPQQTWIALDPLPKSQYSLQTRVLDLVQRMIAVRQTDLVKAAFTVQTTDKERGILNPDGSPTEMLLPWRTTASLIGALQSIGSVELPNRSENVLLANEQRAVLVVWNREVKEETMNLGTKLKLVDVWGNQQELPTVQGQQTFTVGPWPTFIVGVDPLLARWRMNVNVSPTRIDSMLGRRQEFEVILKNPSASTASGQVRALTPEAWNVDPRPVSFNVEPHGETRVPISIVLRNDATTGPAMVQFDFAIESERSLRFNLLRQMEIGPEDLEIELTSSLDEAGNLVVRQEIINSGKRDFNLMCSLFASERQLQRARLRIGAGERLLKQYIWDNGKALVGTAVLLRVEEVGTDRIMNYRLNINP